MIFNEKIEILFNFLLEWKPSFEYLLFKIEVLLIEYNNRKIY